MKTTKQRLMELAGLVNEAIDPSNWPLGYFEVKNTFEITPGGGWRVTFTKGDILQVAVSKVDRSLQTITRWNAFKQDWEVKAPPLSGYRDNGGMFPIDAFSGSRTWTAKFAQNTTPMSKGQADTKIKSAAAETVLTAREAVNMLSKLPSKQKVKITIV